MASVKDPAPSRSLGALRLLLASRGALTLVPIASGDDAPPSIVGEICGGPVRGSWWSHPKGKLIYRVATELEASPDVVVAKLAKAKVTFLHVSLWPALLRIVNDRGWRTARAKKLAPDARTLLTRVERAGRLRVDDRALAKAKAALEATALVRAFQEHTETGRHATVLESWRAWAPARVARAAEALTLDDALASLRAAGIELSAIRD